MRRRSFLAGLFGIVAAPLAVEAQPAEKPLTFRIAATVIAGSLL
jgi:hypothetical protein